MPQAALIGLDTLPIGKMTTLSNIFGWSGLTIATITGFIGLFEDLTKFVDIPSEYGLILSLLFLLLNGYFRHQAHQLKLKEHYLKAGEMANRKLLQMKFLQIIEAVEKGMITEEQAEFRLNHIKSALDEKEQE